MENFHSTENFWAHGKFGSQTRWVCNENFPWKPNFPWDPNLPWNTMGLGIKNFHGKKFFDKKLKSYRWTIVRSGEV
jgi:hypothetical protein